MSSTILCSDAWIFEGYFLYFIAILFLLGTRLKGGGGGGPNTQKKLAAQFFVGTHEFLRGGFYLSYIYLGYFVCLCVIECVCVSQLRNALLFF